MFCFNIGEIYLYLVSHQPESADKFKFNADTDSLTHVRRITADRNFHALVIPLSTEIRHSVATHYFQFIRLRVLHKAIFGSLSTQSEIVLCRWFSKFKFPKGDGYHGCGYQTVGTYLVTCVYFLWSSTSVKLDWTKVTWFNVEKHSFLTPVYSWIYFYFLLTHLFFKFLRLLWTLPEVDVHD